MLKLKRFDVNFPVLNKDYFSGGGGFFASPFENATVSFEKEEDAKQFVELIKKEIREKKNTSSMKEFYIKYIKEEKIKIDKTTVVIDI